MACKLLNFLLIAAATTNLAVNAKKDVNLLVVTVASNETDGFQRFMRSAAVYGHKVQVLGMGQPWLGGDVQHTAGGGYKINLLKRFLAPPAAVEVEEPQQLKNDKDKIILVTDSYDVIINGAAADIVKQFKQSGARILFSAETFCWPDKLLEEQYPMVSGPYRYLNSGGFIGYAKDLYEMLALTDGALVGDLDDDQAFYTKLYLDEHIRKKLSMKLDTQCKLFQSLNGAEGEIALKSVETGDNSDTIVENTIHATNPIILHGNGAAKFAINSIGNYVAKSWTTTKGCLACQEHQATLEVLPDVLVGVFIEQPTPFIEQFLERLLVLSYPKGKINLRVHNSVPYHTAHVESFIQQANEAGFQSVTQIAGAAAATDVEKTLALSGSAARQSVMKECELLRCAYYMSIDAEAQLTNVDTLQLLIQQNRTILAPMLKRHNALYANFWGAISTSGYYARSDDYLDIAEGRKVGIWNVPYISAVYLIRGDHVLKLLQLASNNNLWAATTVAATAAKESNIMLETDADIMFCYNLRNAGFFMFTTNQHYYGHLLNLETFAAHLTTSSAAPDLFQIVDNQLEWEHAYIHPQYRSHVANKTSTTPIEQPCPDVYQFPLVSERYCADLITVMENFGQWSTGGNQDTRLQGGYENVPTRDIHMNQVGFEKQWLFFLSEYVRPVQEKLYDGYFHDPPTAIMNFVVRYKPDEQPFLRPHHDASTYTINIALNRAGIDYEGGGCRFLRYDCTVKNLARGWTLMHPGRLTHYHEGLYTTNGTRYIQVSFVDP